MRHIAAATTTVVAARALTSGWQLLGPRTRARWARTNHAGREVTLLEGPTAVSAAVAGVLAGPRPTPSAVLVLVVPGLLGALDDLVGDTGTKGLRGHLTALRRGRVTTGALKIGGIGATGVAAALLERRPADAWTMPAVDAVLVAGSANLVNLLDLRPGRALKVTTAAGLTLLAPGRSRSMASALVGAAAVLPEDLAGESMLGDCGANALGGLLGLALVRGLGPRGRLVAAATVTGLTLASERVSFTRVIESTPGLRELDAWGRPR